MKTPEEIKKGLSDALHIKSGTRYGVMVGYVQRDDIVACIDNLVHRLAQAEEALAFERTYREDQAVAWELKCSLLERETEQAERERDAAVHDMTKIAIELDFLACDWCKHKPYNHAHCKECRMKNEGFEWRGVCEENSKEGSK